MPGHALSILLELVEASTRAAPPASRVDSSAASAAPGVMKEATSNEAKTARR